MEGPEGSKRLQPYLQQLSLPFITYFHYLLLQDGTLLLPPSALIFTRTFSHSKIISNFLNYFKYVFFSILQICI